HTHHADVAQWQSTTSPRSRPRDRYPPSAPIRLDSDRGRHVRLKIGRGLLDTGSRHHGPIAHLGERRAGSAEAASSNLARSTNSTRARSSAGGRSVRIGEAGSSILPGSTIHHGDSTRVQASLASRPRRGQYPVSPPKYFPIVQWQDTRLLPGQSRFESWSGSHHFFYVMARSC